jgi:hypothetical protein
MTTLRELFDKAFRAGRDVQERTHLHPDIVIDGKAVWSELEKEAIALTEKNPEITKEMLRYNESLNDIYDRMDVIIKEFNMDSTEFNPISNHFFMQLQNLVKKKSDFIIQLNRVMQLGYNAGQLSVFLERNTLPADRLEVIRKFVNENNMLNLDTYVSPEIQEIVNRILNNKLDGGYYFKYMKYKNKYMALKRRI